MTRRLRTGLPAGDRRRAALRTPRTASGSTGEPMMQRRLRIRAFEAILSLAAVSAPGSASAATAIEYGLIAAFFAGGPR